MEKVALVLTDSAFTPEDTPIAIDRVYTPSGMDGNIHKFSNSHVGSTSELKSKLSAYLRPSNTQRLVERVKFILDLPSAITIDGVVTKNYSNYVYLEFVFDKRATKDERKDAFTLITNAIGANSSIVGMIIDGEDLF